MKSLQMYGLAFKLLARHRNSSQTRKRRFRDRSLKNRGFFSNSGIFCSNSGIFSQIPGFFSQVPGFFSNYSIFYWNSGIFWVTFVSVSGISKHNISPFPIQKFMEFFSKNSFAGHYELLRYPLLALLHLTYRGEGGEAPLCLRGGVGVGWDT